MKRPDLYNNMHVQYALIVAGILLNANWLGTSIRTENKWMAVLSAAGLAFGLLAFICQATEENHETA